MRPKELRQREEGRLRDKSFGSIPLTSKSTLCNARERANALEQTNRRTNQKQLHSVGKHERTNLGWLGAEGETDTDFADAFERRISEQSVKADGREQKREAGEDREKKTKEALRCPTFPEHDRPLGARRTRAATDRSS